LQFKIFKIIEEEIQSITGLNPNEISLYTLKIDGKLVCQQEKYWDIIYKEKIEKLFEGNGDYKQYFNSNSICSICSTKNIPTTSNATNLRLKFYMTNKPGFSSNLDGNFKNNYNICQNCYQHLMIAERYIDENLRIKIGGLSVYVLPKFTFPKDGFNIDSFSKYIIENTNQIKNLKKAGKILKDESGKFDQFKNSYLINYLFYQKTKSEFQILKLMKEIPPSRIETIMREEQNIYSIINIILGDEYTANDLKIDLDNLWGCIPINNNLQGYSRYLALIESIFSDKPINYDFIINQAVETLKIIRFGIEGTNIWNKNQDDSKKYYFVNRIFRLNMLILFLKKLNLLGGNMKNQKNSTDVEELIPDEISNYWKIVDIYQDNQKKGLFLIGYLIGQVGNEQRSKQIRNKPILNKINFQGMGTEKLKRLTADILEKLRQYQILNYNENIYSASQILIESNIQTWSLSNQENVFFILSGFAYSNFLLKKKSKEKYSKLIEEISEFVKKEKLAGKDVSEFEKILEEAKIKEQEHSYNDATQLLKEIKKQ